MRSNKVIQGWRAIAILMIFLAHTRTFIIEDLTLFSDFGEKGVYIFIVISGVLLYQNSQTKNYAGSLKDGIKYALRKVKVLYPMHICLWLIMFLVTTTKDNLIRNIIFSLFNVTLTQSFIPFSGVINSFNGPSWYLSMCLLLWMLTPLFIKSATSLRSKNGQIAAKSFAILLFIWVLWLNGAHLLMRIIENNITFINIDWFERWLVYSCPVLDFLIFAIAYWGCELFSGKHSRFKLVISIIVIAGSIAIKGNIPLFYNIPFVVAIIYIITYSIDNQDTYFNKILCLDSIVFIGNISPYFFLIHGVVNLLINRTRFVNLRPWVFVCSFMISFGLSSVLYFVSQNAKRRRDVK